MPANCTGYDDASGAPRSQRNINRSLNTMLQTAGVAHGMQNEKVKNEDLTGESTLILFDLFPNLNKFFFSNIAHSMRGNHYVGKIVELVVEF